ncbi:beta-propeller fold lactonase family protein [Herbaspirillum sp. LeCh32-8]|uniref:lactonase family protein n=1 Tax=Herbaspirillum sp. LeCh32-8 TaxID=2821356 RepID=UPI001AE3A465|nr:beta-propeller fold lactonase family protein [Herbaspirillum sp. LeCh32-8]MBP0596573.1 beta-propeller fold lactonase family protein [Herbaspirillum sp. LeCh32-8]
MNQKTTSIPARIATLAVASALTLGSAQAGAVTIAYVSNADSQDIYVLQINADGRVNLVDKVDTGSTVMPLAVSPDRKYLYASLRGQPYSVVSYAIDQRSGKLTALSKAPLADNMANIATDKTGRYLFGASYTGHKISVNAIGADGAVQAPPLAVIATGKNAHSAQVSPDNAFLFASNLGSDVILQFRFDAATGKVAPNAPASVATKAGAGPRHFVFSNDSRFVYSTNELDGTVNTYGYDAKAGTLSLQATDSALPDGFKTSEQLATADLHLTPDGRYLYASERTSNTLSGYRVDAASGKLTRVLNIPTETQPRGFNIDPQGRFLLAVGQKAGLTSYAIDRDSGALKPLFRYTLGRNPNWVEIIDLP